MSVEAPGWVFSGNGRRARGERHTAACTPQVLAGCRGVLGAAAPGIRQRKQGLGEACGKLKKIIKGHVYVEKVKKRELNRPVVRTSKRGYDYSFILNS